MMNGMSNQRYGELLFSFLPRTIKTEEEYETVQAEIDRFVDQETLTSAEEEYLDLLGTLLWAYEAQTENKTAYQLRGVDLLKGLLDLHGLKQKDLIPIFKTESIVSAVLHRKRRLTAEQINKLAIFFKVSQELFFESLPTTETRKAQVT